MAFSKRFPKEKPGSNFPDWIEVKLTEDEEQEVEQAARSENIKIMQESLEDANKIIKNKSMRDYDNNTIEIAKSLFEKRSSHEVFWKEAKCKEKFDSEKYH